VKHRLIYGSILIILTAGLVWFDLHAGKGAGFSCLISILVLAALFETYQIIEKKGVKPYTFYGMLGGALFMFAVWRQLQNPLDASAAHLAGAIAGAVIFFAVIKQLLANQPDGFILNMSGTIFGLIYIGFLGSFSLRLLYIRSDDLVSGLATLMLVVACAKVGDICAFFTGKSIGKHKLLSRISPNKTIEGAIGGLAGSILTVIVFTKCAAWPAFSLHHALIFGLVVGLAAQIGDLVESMIKRDADIKDSGALIPAFGGVLDIMDCLLFAAPVAYYLLVYFQD